ncbi:MAG: amino acid adenylation domain-containing protein [Acidimicrobiia bacterium]|nr:amino acid adenylation domain-containing protein [Acidimicrobiia bacterium]
MTAVNQHDDRETAEANDNYWRGVLAAGGLTTVPRWTSAPVAGSAHYETVLPDDLAVGVHRLADQLGVTVGAVLLAAHAKVLAALSGDRDIVTGYVAEQRRHPLPCRLSTEPASWRAVVAEAHRAESELLLHSDYPVRDLERTLELDEPSFETMLDPCEEAPRELEAGTVLSVGFCLDAGLSSPARQDASLSQRSPSGGLRLLRLTYRTDVVDASFAARIASYHLAALALMVADPGAEHGRRSLLSAEELRFQLEALAGPRTELPDSRFHELFEQRVIAHPDAIVAEHRDRRLTYRELNGRANRLARALVARGVGVESVVAVVTERNLDWMASVLAIFKAGGVYLPIEPHFPSDRIATTLARAGCELVVTEPESTTTLEAALDSLDGVDCFFVETALGEDHANDDLGIEVGFDQLAYIYFTSGSTGEPKGAMCEHGGMLNHLYAKIDDFEIDEGQIVAQIAPQCFDISLWQLISALLVGGRTLLVEQDTLLDPQRFVDKIVASRVAVMQVVPSYLEVLLTYLEQHPRVFPDLHCVSVTGEALTLELAQRWFATQPGIKLANAYGLTETSDDTNHEVMHRAPDSGSVPLGPAVNNVDIRVVDEHLSPVPLGAPGEIVFSGVCVGRGYINDPDRTRLAFMDDPLRPGERLYRSGDYGRWRPDGKLEFRGRRDAQVKIRGFRIEIGEIENAILGVPGVREGAVVVTERTDKSKQLVGFYSGGQLDAAVFQDRLGESLPEYMVPSTFHWRERLPLTDNGKVDKKTLRVLAAELEVVEGGHDAPTTPTEQWLAGHWATVLGIPEDQIGRNDDFFDRGGTSLLAVKVAIALDRAVTLKELTRHPVLADLAALIDGGSPRPSELLQTLSEPADPVSALVCFPYAGGNAVSFQPLARALGDSGLAVYAVELPGHDLAAEREPFAPLADVVEQVAAEISQRGLASVMIWGHSSGTPLAVETARALEAAGVQVHRVFLGAQLPGDAADRRAAMEVLANRTNADIAAGLSADSGYTKLGDLDAPQAEHVGAAYRHDCVSAHEWFVDMLQNPPSAMLSAPVTVVVAVDDPATANYPSGHLDWKLVADSVDLHELVEGDHYFLRTNPQCAAQLVGQAAASLPSSK